MIVPFAALRPSRTSRPPRSGALSAGTALLAAVAALLTACGSDSSDSPAADTASATSDEVTLPVSAVTTRVLDPGAEPRTVFAPQASGDEQQVDLVTESTVVQQIGDQAQQDFSTPAVTLPLTATSTEGDGDNGAILTDLELGTPTSPDATLSASLEATAGSRAGFTRDATGAVTALRITPAPDARDIARSAVEQALNQAAYRAIAFPADPIGPGATWEISQEVVSSIALQQVTTARLDAVDDGVATVSVTVTQTPQSPQWQLPDGQGTLDIDSFALAGTGTMQIDPDQPLPVSGSVTVGGDQSYRDPATATVLRQSTSNTVTWNPAS